MKLFTRVSNALNSVRSLPGSIRYDGSAFAAYIYAESHSLAPRLSPRYEASPNKMAAFERNSRSNCSGISVLISARIVDTGNSLELRNLAVRVYTRKTQFE